MKVLLDNCVDKRLARFLPGHEVVHVLTLGWDRLANGKLLDAAESEKFDIILTVDKNMRFQHNFSKRQISLMTLDAKRIDIESLCLFTDRILEVLQKQIEPGSVIFLQ